MMTVLRVPSIRGPECVTSITQRLLRFKGVDHLRVDVPSQSVRIIYDTKKTNLDAVKNELREAGYSVE